jgi:peptide/nickel transport system substrate-binding protein
MKKYYLLIVVTFLLFSFFAFVVIGNSQTDDFAFYAYDQVPITDWDPNVEFSNGIVSLHNVYETLLRYDPLEDKFVKLLATDYTTSSDGLTWTFTLRKGVKFHDGTNFNADAVKFSVERTINMNKGASFIWEPVDKVNVIDDYTVEFKLKHSAPLDLICSSGYAAFIMSPTAVKSHPDSWFTEGHEAGTGPYLLESYQQERGEVVLTWFKDYWGGWEGNHFKKAVIKGISEAVTRHLLIEKGEADITMALLNEDIASLQDNKNVNVLIGLAFQNLMLYLNTEREPLNNKLLRQALSYAFPYEDVVSYCLEGYGRQSRGPVPYGLWGHSEELFQYKYDLNKAKELLEKAGYAKGDLKLLLTYDAGDDAERKTAELFKAKLAELNIDLEIRGMPWESRWALARDNNLDKRQDIYLMYWWPDVCDTHSCLTSSFYSEEEPFFNLCYYKNQEFDSLVDKGLEESGIDRNKATKTYIDAQNILVEDAPVVFAYDKENIYFLNKTFQGFKNNPAYANVVFFYDTYREK